MINTWVLKPHCMSSNSPASDASCIKWTQNDSYPNLWCPTTPISPVLCYTWFLSVQCSCAQSWCYESTRTLALVIWYIRWFNYHLPMHVRINLPIQNDATCIKQTSPTSSNGLNMGPNSPSSPYWTFVHSCTATSIARCQI